MKILDFVIDVEQAEQDLYRRLANCSQDRTIQSIFEMIAAKERILLKKLQHLKEDPQKNSLEMHREPKLQAQLCHAQTGNCELIDENDISNDLNGYNYILRTEQMVFNLYVKLKKRAEDPDAQALFNLILKEKQLEIERIHAIYDVARVIH